MLIHNIDTVEQTEDPCPVCLGVNGGTCSMEHILSEGVNSFDCVFCGKYKAKTLRFGLDLDRDLTLIERAALSHRIRKATEEGEQFISTRDWLEKFNLDSGLPSPAVQAANIIRYIGDEFLRSGEPIPELPIAFPAVIGAPGWEFAYSLVLELQNIGILNVTCVTGDEMLRAANRALDSPEIIRKNVIHGSIVDLTEVNLTLKGWERYEEEKLGKFSGKIGFIAMKFGNSILESFVREHVKPAIKDIGYELFDMRDVARAGVIDNIMRTQIRDSAFVIVDLTHDNSGAYWEAGYAEGLGKPVIYICEKEKFKSLKTHFDTNHCTTVLWSQDKPDDFKPELIATLRRSLNLFPGAP